jgi:hypothetical protein
MLRDKTIAVFHSAVRGNNDREDNDDDDLLILRENQGRVGERRRGVPHIPAKRSRRRPLKSCHGGRKHGDGKRCSGRRRT